MMMASGQQAAGGSLIRLRQALSKHPSTSDCNRPTPYRFVDSLFVPMVHVLGCTPSGSVTNTLRYTQVRTSSGGDCSDTHLSCPLAARTFPSLPHPPPRLILSPTAKQHLHNTEGVVHGVLWGSSFRCGACRCASCSGSGYQLDLSVKSRLGASHGITSLSSSVIDKFLPS